MSARAGRIPDIFRVSDTGSGELNEGVVQVFPRDCDEAGRWVSEA